jgi:hypothetical protein
MIQRSSDESTFSANDGRRSCWVKEGESILRPKGRGKGVRVLDRTWKVKGKR